MAKLSRDILYTHTPNKASQDAKFSWFYQNINVLETATIYYSVMKEEKKTIVLGVYNL